VYWIKEYIFALSTQFENVFYMLILFFLSSLFFRRASEVTEGGEGRNLSIVARF